MRTTACFFILLLGVAQLNAADLTNKFIRQPGSYPIDTNGSRLNITAQQSEPPSVSITWIIPPGTKNGADTPNILKAKGWFVYVENPNRIWVFDGVDQGALYTNKPKQSAVKHLYFNQKNAPPLPQPFRDALPKALQSTASEASKQ
jgi:hypothetical protein